MAETATGLNSTEKFTDIPTSAADSVYPYNQVKNTVGGHQFEVDDTIGNERIKRTHATGTYEEFLPDGSRVVTVIGQDFTAVISDKTITVGGDCNIVVNGECHITSNEDLNINANKDLNINVAGDMRTKIGGSSYYEVTGDIAMNTESNIKMMTNADLEQKIKGQYRQEVDRDCKITWSGDKNLIWVGKKLDTIIGTSYYIACPEIDLRGGRSLVQAALPGPDGLPLGPGGVNLSSASGFTMGSGIGIDPLSGLPYAVTIQTGDLNLILGSFNAALGNISTSIGEITARAATTLGIALSTHLHIPEPYPVGPPIPGSLFTLDLEF